MKKSKLKKLILIIIAAIAIVYFSWPKEEKILTFQDKTLTKEEYYEMLKKEPYSEGFTFGEKVLEDHIVGVLLDEKYKEKVSEEYVDEVIQQQSSYYVSMEAFSEALEEEETSIQEVKNEIIKEELVYEAFKEYQPISEEFLKEQYEQMIPRGKIFKLILVEDEETALEVIERVENEVEDEYDFEALVHEYSIDEDNLDYGGEYTVVRDFFDPAIENAAIELALGEYTKQPIKTEDGYNILMITRAGSKLSYEEEKENLLRDEYYTRSMDREQYNELIYDLLNDHIEDIQINDESMGDLVERVISKSIE